MIKRGVLVAAVTLAIALPGTAGAAGAGRIAFATYELTGGTPSSTQNVYTATPQGRRTRLVARNATDPTWSPDGRWIAYVRGYRAVWRVRADGTGHRRVSPPGVAATDPAWSPDGRRLTYTVTWEVRVDGYPEQRAAVHVAHADGSDVRKLHRGAYGHGAVWAAEGRRIALVLNGRLATIRRDGTAVRTVGGDVRPGHLQFSPTGRRLAFTDFGEGDGGRAAVRILDLATGTLRTIPRRTFAGQYAPVTWTPDGERLAFLRNRMVREDGIERVGAVEVCTVDPDAPAPECAGTLSRDVMAWEGLSWTG